jgi:uncharacterized protein (UPF0332 family)
MELDRAREALAAAQLCLERNLNHSAASRAYYAMFWIAQHALTRYGVQRSEWSHSALQASFVHELIRRRKLYPALFGQHFNRALQLRLDADYRPKGISQRQAAQAVRWAQEFAAALIEEVSHGRDDPNPH